MVDFFIVTSYLNFVVIIEFHKLKYIRIFETCHISGSLSLRLSRFKSITCLTTGIVVVANSIPNRNEVDGGGLGTVVTESVCNYLRFHPKQQGSRVLRVNSQYESFVFLNKTIN